jgi:hypothetical protein
MAAVEESEDLPKEILGDDYVHFLDAMPEIRTFIEELEKKEKIVPK